MTDETKNESLNPTDEHPDEGRARSALLSFGRWKIMATDEAMFQFGMMVVEHAWEERDKLCSSGRICRKCNDADAHTYELARHTHVRLAAEAVKMLGDQLRKGAGMVVPGDDDDSKIQASAPLLYGPDGNTPVR